MRFAHTTILALAAFLPATLADDVVCTGFQADPADIAACADELTQRGNEACSVTRGGTTVFCTHGGAEIVGVGVGTPNSVETSSPCVDIAIAVGRILDACTHDNPPFGLKSSGETDANNNGDIVIPAVLTT